MSWKSKGQQSRGVQYNCGLHYQADIMFRVANLEPYITMLGDVVYIISRNNLV